MHIGVRILFIDKLLHTSVVLYNIVLVVFGLGWQSYFEIC